jgi:LacI family transcriptional regulator
VDKMTRIGLACYRDLGCWRSNLRGACQFAEARPEWIFVSAPPDVKAIGELRRLGCDGLIVHAHDRKLAESCAKFPAPVVNIATVVPDLPFPCVGVDSMEAGRMAARHLLDCHLNNFAFLGHAWHEYSLLREAGFCEVIRGAGYKVACRRERAWMPLPPRGRLWSLGAGVKKWIAALPKPVGIFVPSDTWAMELAEACQEEGVRVPDEVAIMGVDNDDLLCNLAWPPLSSVMIPAERIGYEAASLLDRLLRNEQPEQQQILLPPSGVAIRQSTDVLSIDDPEVASAVRFIRQRAHLPLKVDDVVQHMAIGRRRLERKFREVLHRRVSEEIRRVRLERAKTLLGGSELAIAKVAERSGFADIRQLSTIFRDEVGVTPRAYRRKARSSIRWPTAG